MNLLDEVQPLSKENPCYDCGSTIDGHHTPSCDLTMAGDILDLPEIEGTQWWDKPVQLILLLKKSFVARLERIIMKKSIYKYYVDCCGGIYFNQHDGGIFISCPICGLKRVVMSVDEMDSNADERSETMMLQGS